MKNLNIFEIQLVCLLFSVIFHYLLKIVLFVQFNNILNYY